ncbi:hypothetical protein MUK42_35419 [Musa troglodytarum]|uniref:Uncharacterized protein n=1 Tax=Musa troglodytarum TaxID=320322 RepID=A0A9E7GM14_9LILI|nr:hypothetical protein MUK42_35419 [Musa troglodytarum]
MDGSLLLCRDAGPPSINALRLCPSTLLITGSLFFCELEALTMELHSHAAAKKLWGYLRRKLLMDVNLLMKRGKLLGRSLGSLMFQFHHPRPEIPTFAPCEYEFSCSNSPNPVFYHAKRRHSYFPCLHPVVEEADDTPQRAAVDLPRIGQRTSLSSPFSVRVSYYSSEEEDGLSQEVDDEAEEFISRFYEQLRAQSRVALLQYQEEEYQEMLARGA